jgi:hypothetical protein
MRVTVVKDDNTVIVDGERHTVDCSSLPSDFHALQWDGDRGEVEHVATQCEHCGVRSKKGNELISDLSPYQSYIDAWHVVNAEAKAAAEAERQADAARSEG